MDVSFLSPTMYLCHGLFVKPEGLLKLSQCHQSLRFFAIGVCKDTGMSISLLMKVDGLFDHLERFFVLADLIEMIPQVGRCIGQPIFTHTLSDWGRRFERSKACGTLAMQHNRLLAHDGSLLSLLLFKQ